MSALLWSSLLLVQTAADSAAPRVVVEHSWLDTMASVAQSLVSVLVLIMLVMGVLLLFALRRSIDELTKLLRSAYDPLRGAIGDVRDVTGELRTLVRGLHAPVTAAGETLASANGKLRAVIDVAEERVARLDALVGIAQEEAERVVIGAASIARGLRAGSRAAGTVLGLSRARRRAIDDEADEAEDLDASDARGGADDGDDEGDAMAEGEETPRIRRRVSSRH